MFDPLMSFCTLGDFDLIGVGLFDFCVKDFSNFLLKFVFIPSNIFVINSSEFFFISNDSLLIFVFSSLFILLKLLASFFSLFLLSSFKFVFASFALSNITRTLETTLSYFLFLIIGIILFLFNLFFDKFFIFSNSSLTDLDLDNL